MTTVERITALDSLIYAYCRSQFQANGVPPDEARIIMECVLSKFRWNCIDASTIGKMLSDPQGASEGTAETGSQAGPKESSKELEEPGKTETEVNASAHNPD